MPPASDSQTSHCARVGWVAQSPGAAEVYTVLSSSIKEGEIYAWQGDVLRNDDAGNNKGMVLSD